MIYINDGDVVKAVRRSDGRRFLGTAKPHPRLEGAFIISENEPQAFSRRRTGGHQRRASVERLL